MNSNSTMSLPVIYPYTFPLVLALTIIVFIILMVQLIQMVVGLKGGGSNAPTQKSTEIPEMEFKVE